MIPSDKSEMERLFTRWGASEVLEVLAELLEEGAEIVFHRTDDIEKRLTWKRDAWKVRNLAERIINKGRN